VVQTISPGIAVEQFILRHYGPNGLGGNGFVVRTLFFLRFAFKAYGFVVVYRQDSFIFGFQGFLASLALDCAGQFFFP
jgi:hypothetical protein